MRTLIALILLCVPAVADEPIFKPVQPVVIFNVQVVESPEYYVCVFTAQWCGPCRRFLESARFREIQNQYSVRIIDVDQDSRWVRQVPSVWLCRKTGPGSGVVVRKWTGTATMTAKRLKAAE